MRKYNNREKNKIEVLRDVIKDLEFQRDNYSKLPNQAKAIQLAINREKKRVDWLQGIVNKNDSNRKDEFNKSGLIVYSEIESLNSSDLVVFQDEVYNVKGLDASDDEPRISNQKDDGTWKSMLLREAGDDLRKISIVDSDDSSSYLLDKKLWKKAIKLGYVNQEKPVNYKIISISEKKDDGDMYNVDFAVIKIQEEKSTGMDVYNNLTKALNDVKETKYCDDDLELKLKDVLAQVKKGTESE